MQINHNMKQSFAAEEKHMFGLKREMAANPERIKCLLFAHSEKCHVLSSFPHLMFFRVNMHLHPEEAPPKILTSH